MYSWLAHHRLIVYVAHLHNSITSNKQPDEHAVQWKTRFCTRGLDFVENFENASAQNHWRMNV